MKTPKQKKRWIQISLLGVILLISFSFLFVYARDDQKKSIGLSSIHTISSIKIENDQTEKKQETESEAEKTKEASEEKQEKTTEVKKEAKKETDKEKKDQPVSTPEKETSNETSVHEQKVPETLPVTQPEEKNYATISIDMINLLDHKGGVAPKYQAFIPLNGVLLEASKVEIQEGDTAFSILKRVCEERGIPLDASNGYVRYINNIGEFDAGTNSGWLYKVNGQLPSIGSSSYKINKNDVIEWRFTAQVGDV